MKKNFTIHNICWAFNKIKDLSPKMVFGIFISRLIYDGMWFFSSAVFIKRIVYSLSNNEGLISIISYIILVGSVLLFLDVIVNYNKNVIFPIESNRIYKGIYSELYKKSLKVDLSCFDNCEFYSKYTMAIDKADQKMISAVEHIAALITGLGVAILIVIEIIKIDFVLIIFLLFPMVSSLFIEVRLNKERYKRYIAGVRADKMFNYINRVMYLPQYAKEMRTTGVFNIISKQFDDATSEKSKVNVEYSKSIVPTEIINGILKFVCVFEGVLLYAVYSSLELERVSFAELTVLTGIMSSAVWMILGVFTNLGYISQDEIYLENLKEFLDYYPKIDEDQQGIRPESFIESIEFDRVTFGFDSDREVLKDVTFKINGGEVVSIVGENGAGKSTLIKLLMRFYDPTSGVIRVNGIDISKYNLSEYRKLFAASFQESSILGLSFEENITLGDQIPENKIKEAIVKAGLEEKIDKLPLGKSTVLSKEFDDEGIELSGGEKQKVCLARAFAQPALIQIFDEPSSALDPVAEYYMFQNILKERKKKTIIMISHRLSSTRAADCVLFFSNGVLEEIGNHCQLMGRRGNYWNMYRKQAKEYMIEMEENGEFKGGEFNKKNSN